MRRTILFAAVAALLAAPAMARTPLVPADAPLASMVAVRLADPAVAGIEATNLPQYVKALVAKVAAGDTLPAGVTFPLENAPGDDFRSIVGTANNVVISWLDPLTQDDSADAPRYGANNDYIAYFGDGWDDDWANGEEVTRHPQFSGSGTNGWMWVNHEYVSGNQPTTTSAPDSQMLTLAHYLKSTGVLTNDVESDVWSQADVDTFIRWFKKQIGGTWMRVYQNAQTGNWEVDVTADNKRYDASDATLSYITGFNTVEPDHDDMGNNLPYGIAVGIAGDCSGGQTPWGTILSAEENVQDYYGNFESAWTSQQKFVPGQGYDPGANISPDGTPSTTIAAFSAQFGRISNPDERHNRDNYGFLVEMDPGMDSDFYYLSTRLRNGDGLGHRKMGDMGRARWENAAVATAQSFYLLGGEPIVMYSSDDRRSGRIYKWVSAEPFHYGMTRAETRALLDEGYLYVAHFAGLDNRTGFTMWDPADTDCNPKPAGNEAEIAANCTNPTEEAPGYGQWIWLSVHNQMQEAPNAAALGMPGMTVGDALRDVNYNSIGGFPTDNDVRSALFTVGMKLGIMELNRPEDVEWNPKYPGGAVLHVAFTYSGRQVAMNQDGVLYDPAVHATESPTRIDSVGHIFTMREDDSTRPGTNSSGFRFWRTWLGTRGTGPHDVARPDNMAIDADGGLWFGTDGNFSRNGTTDAVYYLDLDPAHKTTAVPTYGLPFRVAATPSDAEATGPAFNSTMTTLFVNAQHPGENVPTVISTWPRQ